MPIDLTNMSTFTIIDTTVSERLSFRVYLFKSVEAMRAVQIKQQLLNKLKDILRVRRKKTDKKTPEEKGKNSTGEMDLIQQQI